MTTAELQRLADKGDNLLVQRALQGLKFRSLKRQERLPLATIARQVGRADLSLKILSPVIRPPNTIPTDPTDQEKTIYAASLIRLGANEEGAQLLTSVNVKKAPNSLLFRGHAFVGKWDYRSAIPQYLAYSQIPSLTDREKILAILNLAASYVHEDEYQQAERYLDELLASAQTSLLGSALEVSAQRWIGLKEWSRAEQDLDRAEELLKGAGGLESLFVRKWRVFLEVKRTKGKTKSLQSLQLLREEAFKQKHWETIRDADLLEGITCQRVDLLHRLYFGTPHESFRTRLFRSLSFPLDLPDHYDWTLSPGGTKLLDLNQARAQRSLSEGQFKLLRALTSDFYRPFRVASLHSLIYPGEYFNPFTSPARVRQAVVGLHAWFSKNRLPISIVTSEEAYRFNSSTQATLRVPNPAMKTDSTFQRLLKEVGNSGEFTVTAANRILKLPPRTLSRLLKKGVDEGFLEREGKGKSLLYRLARRN